MQLGRGLEFYIIVWFQIYIYKMKCLINFVRLDIAQ